MTVHGVGLDLVDVEHFAEQLATPGTRFALEAFTAAERVDAGGPAADGSLTPEACRSLAARFAVKEAFVKAWSGGRFATEPAQPGWLLHEVEVVEDTFGRPGLVLHGQIAASLRRQFPQGWSTQVSLSHDGRLAGAVVVLEVNP